MSTVTAAAKTEMLQVLRQIATHYASAEQIVLAYRASLDTGDESPDLSRRLQPVMDQLAVLDRQLSNAYGRWNQKAAGRDHELQTAVDCARQSMSRLFQQIDAAVTTAQSHLQRLAPSVAAASSHRQMAQAYRRSTSSNAETDR